jgi:hypothetical protein
MTIVLADADAHFRDKLKKRLEKITACTWWENRRTRKKLPR